MIPVVVLLHPDLGEHLRLARGEMSSRRNGESGYPPAFTCDPDQNIFQDELALPDFGPAVVPMAAVLFWKNYQFCCKSV